MPVPRRRPPQEGRPPPRRRWRDYRTASGRSPVEEFIDSLSDDDAAAVLARMAEVRQRGLVAARHLEGDIWEVRVDRNRVIYRVLFAEEGSRGRVLLAREGFKRRRRRRLGRRSSWRSAGSATGAGRDTARRAVRVRVRCTRVASTLD
jgi:hypothetical protein